MSLRRMAPFGAFLAALALLAMGPRPGLAQSALADRPPAALDEGAPPPPTEATTPTLIEAQRAGNLKIKARGAGEDRVDFTITNVSPRRLEVVIPPGLIAAASAGQFQSMGLGSLGNRPGSFGGAPAPTPSGPIDDAAAATGDSAFRSVGLEAPAAPRALAIPEGQSVEVSIPAVCLNYGAPTPTARNEFRLVTAEEYSKDPRVGVALRALHATGTSQKVAQAVMWHVCNGLTFAQLASRARDQLNLHEVALAAGFVKALGSAGEGPFDPTLLRRARLFVRVHGPEGDRLARELEGHAVLGLPLATVGDETPRPEAPALGLSVIPEGRDGAATVRVQFSHGDGDGWHELGKLSIPAPTDRTDGAALAKVLDQKLATTFVVVKTVRKARGVTVVKVENRLPFTLAAAGVRVGDSQGATTIDLDGLGTGPRRETLIRVPAEAPKIDRVVLNGL